MQNLGEQNINSEDLFFINENEYLRYHWEQNSIIDQICELPDTSHIFGLIQNNIELSHYHNQDHQTFIGTILKSNIVDQDTLTSLAKLDVNFERQHNDDDPLKQKFQLVQAIRSIIWKNDIDWCKELANARGIACEDTAETYMQINADLNEMFDIQHTHFEYHIKPANDFQGKLLQRLSNPKFQQKLIKTIQSTLEANKEYYQKWWFEIMKTHLQDIDGKTVEELHAKLNQVIKIEIHHEVNVKKENMQYPLLKQIRKSLYNKDENWQEELDMARDKCAKNDKNL